MALDRSQVGYNPTEELVRVTASPNLQDTRVRSDLNDSGAYQLAKQLGANFDGLNNLQTKVKQNIMEDAQQTANSMTTDELAGKIKSGEIHSTISPVYNAVINNTHYSNIAANMQRDTLAKITTGELKFEGEDGNAKLEEYLIKQRNEAVQNADAYGVAGFDTHWNAYKDKAITANFNTIAKQRLEAGIATGAESIDIAIAGSQDPQQLSNNFKAAWTKATLPSGSLLTDDARKEVLNGAVFNVAKAGNVEGLTALLNTKLDNGLTVRHALSGKDGGVKVAQMEYTANNIAASNANRAQVQYFKNASEQSVQQNGQLITSGVSQDKAFSIPTELPYTKPDGTTGYMKTEPDIYRALNQKTQGMSLAGRLQTFSTNGIDDQETRNTIQAGLNNVNSITFNEPGKPAGQLNANFNKSFEAYQVAKMVDPAYATKLAGADGSKTMEDIDLLKQTMGMDLNGAAMVVAQARNNPTYINGNDNITKASNKIVADLNPSWFGKLFGADELTGNISNIRADVKRSGEIMIAAGASVDTTMKSLGDYVQKNVVNVNGSLVYLRSIPTSNHSSEVIGGAPTQIKRLVSEMGTDIAIKQGFDPDEVQMSVSKDGTNYTFMARNQPLLQDNRPLVLTKDQIKDWMDRDFENYKYDKFLEPARDKFKLSLMSNHMTPAGLAKDIASSFTMTPVDKYLTSTSGYRKLVQSNLEKKPIADQRAWAKEQIKKGASFSDPATPVKDYSSTSNPEPDLGYGKREDGTQKGKGYFGELMTPDGKKMTEYSIGMEINGKEVLMPSLVPTLTKAEVDHIVKGKPLTDAIMDKAVAHAKKRIAEGKSPFYGQADEKSGGK